MKLNNMEKMAVHTAVLNGMLANPSIAGVGLSEVLSGQVPDMLLEKVKETSEKYIALLETGNQEGSVNDENGH